jgi:hypothetical protein
MQNNMKLNMKIHNLIRTNKSSLHDKCQKTNLNTTAPLCNPRVVGGVREGVSWMAIASSGRRLEGVVSLKKLLSPTGRPPSGRGLWSSRSTRDGPPPVDCASTSTNAATANASPARYVKSWKSSIIAWCCSCVGWALTTGGAPVSCVPPISSAVSRNKSSN